MPKFSFASVNMRRRNAFMHVLLNDNSADDILFVQEHGSDGLARRDQTPIHKVRKYGEVLRTLNGRYTPRHVPLQFARKL